MTGLRAQKILYNIVEWSILSAIFLVPIYFAFFQENYTVFDLNKSVLLRLCLLVALSAVLIVFSLTGKIPRLNSKSMILIWVILLVAFIVSTVFSLQPMISLFGSYERQQGLLNLVAYLLFFLLLIIFFHSREQLKRIIVTLNISAGVVCLYGILQVLGLDFLHWSESSELRIFSTFGQPNFFGHYLVVMIPLTIYSIVFLGRHLFVRLSWSLLLVSELFCLLFTYSRGAWLALSVAVFICLVSCLWYYKKKALTLILVSIAVVLGVILVIPNTRLSILTNFNTQNSGFFARAVSVFDFNSGSTSVRIKYWKASWQILKQASLPRILIGFGPDVETNLFVGQYQPDWAYYEGLNAFPDRAHNNFFDIIFQFGILGLGALLSLAFVCLKNLYKMLKHETGDSFWFALAIAGSLIAYTVNNFFSFSLTTMTILFYVLLALAWRLSNSTESITYSTLEFLHPFSRWILGSVFIVFMSILFYGYNIRPLVADYYYMQVKKGEAQKDCWKVLNNMENVMEWYPTSYFYSEIYLSQDLNCFASLPAGEDRQKVINNIIDQTQNPVLEKGQFYTLINLSHAYSILGYYADSKYYVLAEKYYEEMLSISKNITTTYQDYGRMKLWQGRSEEARKLFLAGISVLPTLDKAVPNSQHTAVIAQQLAHFYYLIGLSYSNEKNLVQAIINYKQALKIDPTLVLAYKELADIAYNKKNLKEAIEYNKQALAIDYNNSLWAANLANLYLEMGDKITALRYASLADKLEPGSNLIKKILDNLKLTK